jgi:hypothetical protein
MGCTGILAGGGPSLRRFLHAYTQTVLGIGERNCHRWIPDQIILNYMVYHQSRRSALEDAGVHLVFSEDGDHFLHTDWQDVRQRAQKPWGVRNWNGSIIPLVHAFDRSPELTGELLRLLANETALPRPYVKSNGVAGWVGRGWGWIGHLMRTEPRA